MLEQFLRTRLQTKPLQLMTHMVCGYPSFNANLQMLQIMEEAQVAAVEFQFPFSEPMADGPLFCRANQASLTNGTKVSDCFDLMRQAQSMSFARLMMGYYNTALQLGEENFCKKLQEVGATGFILPDLPPEEANSLEKAALKHQLSPIYLMTPATTLERLQYIGKRAHGFVYCVARRGVTGAKTAFDADIETFLQHCRQRRCRWQWVSEFRHPPT
jgi:tryptophan synthase alpha chain